MGVLVPFERAKTIRLGEIQTRQSRREATIAKLALRANVLQAYLEEVFGSKVVTVSSTYKEFDSPFSIPRERFAASFDDYRDIKIYAARSDWAFTITSCGDTREEAIAAMYYRMTSELSVKETVRRYLKDDTFEDYTYDRWKDGFCKVRNDGQRVVALKLAINS